METKKICRCGSGEARRGGAERGGQKIGTGFSSPEPARLGEGKGRSWAAVVPGEEVRASCIRHSFLLVFGCCTLSSDSINAREAELSTKIRPTVAKVTFQCQLFWEAWESREGRNAQGCQAAKRRGQLRRTNGSLSSLCWVAKKKRKEKHHKTSFIFRPTIKCRSVLGPVLHEAYTLIFIRPASPKQETKKKVKQSVAFLLSFSFLFLFLFLFPPSGTLFKICCP